MTEKLRVVFVSPEVSPYAKSGEMADVVGSLPKYLGLLGMEVRIFMPHYRRPEIESLPKSLVREDLTVPVGKQKVKSRIFKSELGKMEIFFVDSPKYFWREQIYGTGRDEYLDNDERFIFFNRAVVEYLLKAPGRADVIHCHNWPAALIPALLRTKYASHPRFKSTATVLTLHNLAYQGDFPAETFALTGLDWELFQQERVSHQGRFNFLKAGINFADVITTVSSTYRREILMRKYGFGMESVLRKRKHVLFSIRNGIDYENWNPVMDPFIAENYSAPDFAGKQACKKELMRELALRAPLKRPLIGIVSYISAHKGFDILLDALESLMRSNVGFVIQGRGHEDFEEKLKEAEEKYPDRIAVRLDGSPALTHKILAGSDMVLIPSRYEPCGLNQLYGFRYGTVPVVRATGGLKETVREYRKAARSGTGFVFIDYSSQALSEALEGALLHYQKPRVWKSIMRSGYSCNYSWEAAAKRYSRLYRYSMKLRKGGAGD